VPVPDATTVPKASVTVTVHGKADDSRAVKRTLPPIPPNTTGE
jgi:hypothetical protein